MDDVIFSNKKRESFLKLDRCEMISDIFASYENPGIVSESDFIQNNNLIVWKCRKYLQLFDKEVSSHLGQSLSKNKINDLFRVRFVLAMKLFPVQPSFLAESASLEVLEDICSDYRCPQEIMNWSLYNYGLFTGILKKRQRESSTTIEIIPKIIHMIFFGETPLETQHVRSITSVLEHMCSQNESKPNHEQCYKLYFHTCFDGDKPRLLSHSDWSKLNSYEFFIVKRIDAPQEFDGFPLKHVQYKADIARVEILKKYGGIYIDCDILVTKPFDKLIEQIPDSHGIIPTFFVCEEGPRNPEQKLRAIPNEQVLNAFLACTPEHPILDLWLEETKGRIREGEWAYHIRLNEFIWLQNPCSIAKYGIRVLENKCFFSHSWQENHLWTTDHKLEPCDGEYGYHLWNTISSNHGLKGSSVLPGAEYSQTIPYTKLADMAILISTTESVQKRISTLRLLREIGFTTQNIHICISDRHKNPVYGCRAAHIDAIKKAKDFGCGSVLIVEDDIGLNKNISNSMFYEKNVCVMPNDWDILYLGGILTRVDKLFDGSRQQLNINDKNARSSTKWVQGQIWCNHAYVVKRHMFDVILSSNSRMEKYFATHIDHLTGLGVDTVYQGLCGEVNIDHVFANMLSQRYKFYLCATIPIIQIPELSRFDNKFDWNVWTIKNTGQTDPFAGKNIEWQSI